MRIGPITISWTKAERNEQKMADAIKAGDEASALAIDKEYEANKLLACNNYTRPLQHMSREDLWT